MRQLSATFAPITETERGAESSEGTSPYRSIVNVRLMTIMRKFQARRMTVALVGAAAAMVLGVGGAIAVTGQGGAASGRTAVSVDPSDGGGSVGADTGGSVGGSGGTDGGDSGSGGVAGVISGGTDTGGSGGTEPTSEPSESPTPTGVPTTAPRTSTNWRSASTVWRRRWMNCPPRRSWPMPSVPSPTHWSSRVEPRVSPWPTTRHTGRSGLVRSAGSRVVGATGSASSVGEGGLPRRRRGPAPGRGEDEQQRREEPVQGRPGIGLLLMGARAAFPRPDGGALR